MKRLRIMKKILVILMLFALLTVNYMPVFATNSTPAFYYSGTQKGTYNAKTSFWGAITKFLADIADYLIGLATLGQRMFLVGWTSIAEVALNETLEATAGNDTEFILNPAVLDMSNSDEHRKVTVENIVFNKVPLLDANFFKTEIDDSVTGTGIVKEQIEKENSTRPDEAVNKNGQVTVSGKEPGSEDTDITENDELTNPGSDKNVITIIKNTIAKWYYAMRSLAIGCMLLVLLYIALRLIVATMGQEKAKYKQMLYNWLVGFAVIFCIHYVMLFVFMINEELVAIFNKMSVTYVEKDYKAADSKTNTEMELSLYASLRSRAYDIKASRGWIGTILYMVLVYYAVRFTLVYLKRYFTIMILAMMAPIISATYAFGKIRTGKAESFNKWLKEFVFAVLLQSVHAMVYVTLITQLLRLTETSLVGAILSFMVLNFMLKADGIVKRIFNMSTGQHSSLDNIMNSPGAFVESVMGLKAGADIARAYGKYWLKPVYGAMGNVAGTTLSAAGNTLLGAAGGAMHFLDDRRAAKTFDMEGGARGGKRAYDKDGKLLPSDNEKDEEKRNKRIAKRGKYNPNNIFGVDPITGAFNDQYLSQRMAASKLGKRWANTERGRNFMESVGKKADVTRAKLYASAGIALGDISKDDIRILGGIDKQLDKLTEERKKYIRKQQKEQIKKLMTVVGGIGMTTLAVPMMVAHPKMGISLLAQGHAMKQSVAKLDKKGKKARTLYGYVEKGGKKHYKVQGLMTSAGTYVKNATGIGFIEGLTTNINDDIAKVQKQERKFGAEFEKLYATRDRFIDIEMDKQQRLLEQQLFLADPQQAMKIKMAQEQINSGEYSVYNGRLMETNPLMKKFLEENGISTPEGAIALNMMMTIGMQNGGIQGGSLNEALSGFSYNDSMNPEIYKQMRFIQQKFDENPGQADDLIRMFAVQNATAAALDKKEYIVTEVLEDAGVMQVIKELDESIGNDRNVNKKMLSDEFGNDKRQYDDKLEEMKNSIEAQKAMLDVDELEGDYDVFELNRMRENIEAMEKQYNELTKANEELKKYDEIYDIKVGETIREICEEQGLFETTVIKQQTQELEQKQQVIDEVKEIVEEKQATVDRMELERNEQSTEAQRIDEEIKQMEKDATNQEQQLEIENKKKELEEAKERLEQAEKALEQATIDLNAEKDKLTEAESTVQAIEERIEAEKDKIVENAMDDCSSINNKAKTRIELGDSSVIIDDELCDALKETGGFETLLEMERRDKPEECQKLETVILNVAGEGGVEEVPVEVKKEDMEARTQDIMNLVDEIKGYVSDSVMVEDGGLKNQDGEIVTTESFTKDLEKERKDQENRDVVKEIASEIEKVIQETTSASKVDELIEEMEKEGKNVDVEKMTEKELVEFRRNVSNEEHDYIEKVKKPANDVVSKNEQLIAKAQAERKIEKASEKDKKELKKLLEKIGVGDLTVEEFNKMVRQINSVNTEAEEAFVKEMQDSKSVSNQNHSKDYTENSRDKLRRGLNSESVRSTRERSITEIRAAEILMENDYAQFEMMTAKSSSNYGKKLEKGPVGSLSYIIKNLG